MALSTGHAHCNISEVNHSHFISSLFFFLTLKTLNASLRTVHTTCAKPLVSKFNFGQKVERYLSQQGKCNFPCLYDVLKLLK